MMKHTKQLLAYFCIVSLMTGVFCGCGSAAEEDKLPILASPENIGESLNQTEGNNVSTDLSVTENEASQNQESEVTKELEEMSEPELEENSEELKDFYITISAAGDCSLGNYYGQDYSYSFIQTYENEQNPGYFFENVRDLFEDDDMTIVNLEGVLTNSSSLVPGRTYNISGPPEYAKILTEGNVETVSMANNHRLDYGEGGTADTVQALEAEEIIYAYDNIVGMYEIKEKDIKVGFVSVNAINNSSAVEKQVQDGLEKLREDGADLLLVCCHWGIEKEYYPNDTQRNLGKKCIDWGADLVIGHHPHVLQGIEEYQGKFILYSLGNFSFGANRNPTDKDTMIYQQTFHFIDGVKQEDGTARVIPCKVSSINERNNYQPTPVLEDDWTRIIGRLNQFSAPYGVTLDEEGYCKR